MRTLRNLRSRTLVGTLLVASLIVCLTANAMAAGIAFEIAAGDATTTLKQFAAQAHVQLLFDYKSVAPLKTPAVKGQYEPSDALKILLRGSGLTFRQVNDHTFAVIAAGSGTGTSASPMSQSSPASGVEQKEGKDSSSEAQGASAVHAQASATSSPDTTLQEIIVTATPVPRTDLETAAAVTTINAEQIEETAPRNLAELVRLVPGYLTQPTGGETHNNFPDRVRLVLDGLPMLEPDSGVPFAGPDDFLPLSTFTEKVEAVRGGAAAIYMSDAAEGVFNIISREGSRDFKGEAKLEVGDYHRIRNDVWVSGPMNESTTYAVGGWWLVDNGIRDPGFLVDKGRGISANIKHLFADDRGYFKVSGSTFSYSLAFLVDIPLQGSCGMPCATQIPGGPNIHTGPSISLDTSKFYFPNSPEGPINSDTGRTIVNLSYVGTETQINLAEGLKLTNLNRYTNIPDQELNLNNANGAPASLQSIVDGLATVNTTPGQYAAALLSNGHYNYRLTYPGQDGAVAAANPAAAATLNGNGLGQVLGVWRIHQTFQAFQNDLKLVQTLHNDDTVILGGVYWSLLTYTRLWGLSSVLEDITQLPHRVDVTYLNAATNAPIGQYTYNGITQMNNFGHAGSTDAHELTPYVFAQQKIGNWLLDGGIRFTNIGYDLSRQQNSSFDLNTYLPAGSSYPSLRNAVFPNGMSDSATTGENDKTYTLGANYTFTNNMAAFARYSNATATSGALGNLATGGDNLYVNSPPDRQWRVDGGFKYSTARVDVSIDAFYRKHSTLNSYFDAVGNFITAFQQDQTKALEFQTAWRPVTGLVFDLRGVLQNRTFICDQPCFNTVPGAVTNISYAGLQFPQQPKVWGSLAVDYKFSPTRIGTPGVDVIWNYVGKRYQDNTNTQALLAYNEVQAGFSWTGERLIFRLAAANLFNSAGLTEGNGANPNFAITTPYFQARPLMPRTVVGSVTYKF